MDKDKNIMTAKEYQDYLKSKTSTKKKVIKEDFVMTTSPVDILKTYGFDPNTSFYIRGHVYSSKNSKRILHRNPKEGQNTGWKYNNKPVLPFIADSEAVEGYRKATWFIYKDLASLFQKRIEGSTKPLVIQFTFIRMNEQKFDFPNICQLVMDMMVYYHWIPDDDIRNILPVPPLSPQPSHFVSDKFAGVIITIL